jgi:hypothetical protein
MEIVGIIIGIFVASAVVIVSIGLEMYRSNMRRMVEKPKPSRRATRWQVIRRSITWQTGLNLLGFAGFYLLFWPWGRTEADRIVWVLAVLFMGIPLALVSTGLNALLLWGGIRIIEGRAKRTRV